MRIIIIATSIALCACKPSAKKVDYPVMPDELKDCKIFEIVGTPDQERLVIVRCPDSQVSTYWETGNSKSGDKRHTVVTL